MNKLYTTHRNVENINDIIWEEKFELLKEFKEEFGRFPKAKEVYKGVKLGTWCITQRQINKGNMAPGSLTVDKLFALQSIGFDFGFRKEDDYMIKFKLVKQFIERYNRFPKYEEEYKGVKIGKWYSNQKIYMKNGRISKEKQKLISSLELRNTVLNTYELLWLSHYNLLVEFKIEHDRFPTAKETYKEFNIGVWCCNQLQTYRGTNKAPLMKKERVDMLKSIGLIVQTNDSKWMYQYNLLKEFIKRYNRRPKWKEEYKGYNLGIWLDNQMQAYKKNKLTEQRIELLNRLL